MQDGVASRVPTEVASKRQHNLGMWAVFCSLAQNYQLVDSSCLFLSVPAKSNLISGVAEFFSSQRNAIILKFHWRAAKNNLFALAYW